MFVLLIKFSDVGTEFHGIILSAKLHWLVRITVSLGYCTLPFFHELGLTVINKLNAFLVGNIFCFTLSF